MRPPSALGVVVVTDTVLTGLVDGYVKWIIRSSPLICTRCAGSGLIGGHTEQANDLESPCDVCKVWADVTPPFRDPTKKRMMGWVGTGGARVVVGVVGDTVPERVARGEFILELPVPICSMAQASADNFAHKRFVLAGVLGNPAVAVGFPIEGSELTMPPDTLGGQSVQVGSWAHRVRQ